MENHLTRLIELLKKVTVEKNLNEIVSFEKEITEISLLIIENKERLNESNLSKLNELGDLINQLSKSQNEKLILFKDFKDFLDKRKINQIAPKKLIYIINYGFFKQDV